MKMSLKKNSSSKGGPSLKEKYSDLQSRYSNLRKRHGTLKKKYDFLKKSKGIANLHVKKNNKPTIKGNNLLNRFIKIVGYLSLINLLFWFIMYILFFMVNFFTTGQKKLSRRQHQLMLMIAGYAHLVGFVLYFLFFILMIFVWSV